MTEVASKLNRALRDAEAEGSWAEYTVMMLGECDTGDEDLDNALAALYTCNETVHRLANKLALRYDLEMFEGR